MIRTEFDKSQKWVIEGTGEADVYRIVKEDKSDWIAVLRCNAIHTPKYHSLLYLVRHMFLLIQDHVS